MEKELFQSGQPVLTNDLLKAQSALEDAITSRLTDSFSPGILQSALNSFAVTPNNLTFPPSVNIDTGIAYDVFGNRVAITSSTNVFINPYTVGSLITSGTPALNGVPNGPLTTTNNGVSGFTATPQNSGSKAVPLFAGKYNYLWLGYVETIDPSVFILQNLSNLRLFTSSNDGYQIQVVSSNTVVVNPSTLNPDQTNFSFIFLGYVDNTGAPAPLAPGNINTSGLTYYTLENNRLLGKTPNLSESDKTTIYGLNQTVDLNDHLKAVGGGTVAPNNPHGMNLSDLSNVGTTVALHETDMHSSGITGTNTSSLGFNIDTSNLPGSPAFSANAFEVTPILSGQVLGIRGTDLDTTTALGSTIELYMASTLGVILPADTYTVYVDSIAKTVKLAAVSAGVGGFYQRKGFSPSIPLVQDTVVATSSLTNVHFVLYTFSFNGISIISSVVDERVFGNTDTTDLAHDSATNTFDINHNVNITGSLTSSSTNTGPLVASSAIIGGVSFPVGVSSRQVLTSGISATYNTPAGCRQLRVRMVGGGGGGSGSTGAGFVGGTTSFNSVTAVGGNGGNFQQFGGAGGTGGTGTASFRSPGNSGGNGNAVTAGGAGGGSLLGGGAGPTNVTTGFPGQANSGGGASGYNTTSGGGGGEYVELIINSPSATYTYTVGAGGAGGTGSGAAGGSGVIIVDEIY